MIKTKSVYAAAEPSDGRRILVTRYHPRGVRRSAYDAWDRRLTPSPALLKAYKSGGMKWADFEESPVRELLDSTGGMESLRELREYSRTRTITLLCYEPDGEPCHRHLLKRLIEDHVLSS